jgi:hypothetical protein
MWMGDAPASRSDLASCIPFAGTVLELLSRISIITARSPIVIAPAAGTLSPQRVLGSRRRRPRAASGKPFHLRIGMPFAQAIERRQQICAIGCAKRSWQPPRQNRPVRVSRWHVFLDEVRVRLSRDRAV